VHSGQAQFLFLSFLLNRCSSSSLAAHKSAVLAALPITELQTEVIAKGEVSLFCSDYHTCIVKAEQFEDQSGTNLLKTDIGDARKDM